MPVFAGADLSFVESPEQAEKMAEKYQALAERYRRLAERQKQVQADNQTVASLGESDDAAPGDEQVETGTEQTGEAADKADVLRQLASGQKVDVAAEQAQIVETIERTNDVQTEAQSQAEGGTSAFDGSNIAFDFTSLTGNSNTTTVGLQGMLQYIPLSYDGRWENTLELNYNFVKGGARGTDQADETTVNNFKLVENSHVFFSEHKSNGITWQASYLNDKFDGFHYVLNESIGLLRRFVATETMTLDFSLLPGLQQLRRREDDQFRNLVSATAILNYKWNITDYLSFSENVESVSSAVTTTTTSTTTLTTVLMENFSLNTSFMASYSSKPQPGTVHTNTRTKVSLQYNF